MSGRKHHYIPQFLLKGFGERKKNEWHVCVYNASGKSFRTSTKNVAVERDFYSEHDEEGSFSLDDKITSYEARLAKVIENWRIRPPNDVIGREEAVEIVIHLTSRIDSLRKFASAAMKQTTDIVAAKLETGDLIRNAVNTTTKNINREAAVVIRKMLRSREEYKALSPTGRRQIEARAYGAIKDQLQAGAGLELQFLADRVRQMEVFFGDFAKEAHNKSLSKHPGSPKRTDKLSELVWRIDDYPNNSIILPDTVAIARKRTNEFQPYIYIGSDFDELVMPISHSRILVGSIKSRVICEVEIQEAIAKCSHNYFLSREQSDRFANLIPFISRAMGSLMKEGLMVAERELGQLRISPR